ncbi:MAG: nucleotide exchange factor GrpE [Acidobacteriota bacterium]|nr:nucleotide exchange factor GrpE [Acidobacteriota bacterium]
MFKRKKMNENDEITEEYSDEETQGIPTNDKRRFNARGERIDSVEEMPKEAAKSAGEIELESKLKAETERREAAETKLISVQAKFDEAKTGLERETADMRTRLMKTLEDRAKQGQLNFLTILLPVLDNLNLAIDASEKDASFEHLLGGVKGTARSFEQALMSVGVEAVPSVGADFDPELHEAIDTVQVDEEQDGKVTAEYSRGYKFSGRLLRPARVQVGKAMVQSAGE